MGRTSAKSLRRTATGLGAGEILLFKERRLLAEGGRSAFRRQTARTGVRSAKQRMYAFDPLRTLDVPSIAGRMGDADKPFLRINGEELDALAHRHGFQRKGKQNWVRRTTDFVQLLNLQRSQWADEDRYLNFALWPLALGEPPSITESKFHFRTRAEDIGATDLPAVFLRADALTTLAELSSARAEGLASGLMTPELRALLLQC